MDMKRTGELIAEKRKEQGLSQAELAQQLHVTDKAVSRWETGRGAPSVNTLEPLAEALGLSVSELLSGRVLTADELPGEAGGQLVASLRNSTRMLRNGVLFTALAFVLLIALLLGAYVWYHYAGTVPGNDTERLTRAAGAYFSQFVSEGADGTPPALPNPDTLELLELTQQGDYMAALLHDDSGHWHMCVFERDPVFSNRWCAGGGRISLPSGELTSWNFGSPQNETVIVVCGSDLPSDAAYYSFRNSGTVYLRPARTQILDLFVIPDGGSDINGYPILMTDKLQAWDARAQGLLDGILNPE